MKVRDNRWLVLGLMCSGLLLVAMDNTILNVALPAIAASLRPSATGLLWIVDLYSLVVAGLLVTAGTASDRLGRKRFFIAGMVLFGVASVVAAAADSTTILLLSRVLRGIGGAMIMPATLSIIRTVFTDDRERAFAIGIWTSTAAAGAAIGPIVAGAMLERFWWGSVFLTSLPIIVVAVALTIVHVPESRDPNPGRFDPPSVVLSMASIVGIVYGIKELASHASTTAAVALAAGLVLGAVFIRRQNRLDSPLLDLSLFKAKRFTAATLSVLLSFFGFFGVVFFLTQYFQVYEGFSPLTTGVWLLPLALASLLASPLTGAIVRKLGMRIALAGSFGLIAVSLSLFALLGGSSDNVIIVLGFVGLGIGASIAATAGAQAIMTSAPPERAGGAAAIQETSFELGAGLGVAILGSVMAAELGGRTIAEAGKAAFFDGLATTALVSAGVMLVTAALAALWLPAREAEFV
ncbi:MFS transporter [Kibdelosporangium aridum]|uniref:MFS transporter, DHA2 family, multidrug resistance protein n=1 Tax=Kibdelosporangium aridum TaxID=2030 RepID=A0A1Y5XVE8_KIBAR|nr:MFS transporter [Kibdelosporangium aridum]SMD19130.1 MFS transporter, DHA2 family, multidrug resistance protein [Kibdelosporangium aridum]